MTNPRLDPSNDVRVDRTYVDMGDKASTYVFTEAGEGWFSVGNGKKSDAHVLLKALQKTGDARRPAEGEGHQKRLELFEEDAAAADDFIALIEAARRGEAGLELSILGAGEIEIRAAGSWSDDILRFEGDYVTDALSRADLGGFDLQNHTDQIKFFEFDAEEAGERSYTGGDRDLVKEEGYFGDIFKGSFLNDGDELKAVVEAALSEHYGMSDTRDLAVVSVEDDGVVIEVTTHHSRADDGLTTKTMVISGSEVGEIVSAFRASLPSGLDFGDGKSKAAYRPDALDKSWAGGAGAHDDIELGGGTSLDDVIGNQIKPEDIPELVRLALDHQNRDGAGVDQFGAGDDLRILAGGERGDDHMSLAFDTPGGVDTLVLEGSVTAAAIEDWHA